MAPRAERQKPYNTLSPLILTNTDIFAVPYSVTLWNLPFETSKNLRHCNSIAAKTYSSKRDIPYIDLLDSIFKKHNSSGFLFLLPNGNFIRPTTINTHFTNTCTKAGIRLIEKTKTIKKKGFCD